jgi:hypothetical protein
MQISNLDKLESGKQKAEMARRSLSAFCFLLASFCATQPLVRRAQEFRRHIERGEYAEAERFVAPGARMYFERREGAGEAYTVRGGSWDHWDTFFHSRNRLTDWRVNGRTVTATAHETNDFMQLIEWKAPPYTIMWTFDDSDRVIEVLIMGGIGKTTSRLDEVKAWAEMHHPGEIAYLMPKGRIDPTGDRAERWKTLLLEWRESQGTNR